MSDDIFKMHFDSYRKLCYMTWNANGSLYDQVQNSLLGVIGEYGELLKILESEYPDGNYIESDHTNFTDPEYTLVHGKFRRLATLQEYREKLVDESGDLLYYLTVHLDLATTSKLNMMNVHLDSFDAPTNPTISRTWIAISNQCEHIKKTIYHGKASDYNQTYRFVFVMYNWLNDMLLNNNIGLKEVMQYNVDKLSKRYPYEDGFKLYSELENSNG